MQNEIYLDNSATTPVAEEVVQAMEPYWSVQYGNPSSPHLRGVAAQKIMNACRAQLASILQVNPNEIGRASCRERGQRRVGRVAEDGIRDFHVTGVQTCALPI